MPSHEVPDTLRRRFQLAGQDHIFRGWDQLSPEQRQSFVKQLETLDLDLLGRLYQERDRQQAVPADERISPVPLTTLDAGHWAEGEEALRRGEVAALVVAGGQGTRLGSDQPKGMFPVGPVSGNSLFQIHAEKVLATSRRYGHSLPLLIMTSPAAHEKTRAFFQQHRYFGLPESDVFFFCQGTMPALDLTTGKLLLEAPGQLFLGPNGHGGTLLALADSGLFDKLRHRGVRHIFYFQVDNPLAQVADPAFLGCHIRARAEVSTLVIPKDGPLDKLGNVLLIDGRCGMIEYSDLPQRLASQTNADGSLRLRLGNTAIHIFDVDFMQRMATGAERIPFHVARKKVACLDDRGQPVQPATENALKFEMFIFDVLPRAQRWTVVEVDPRLHFHPLKNALGKHSPDSVRQAIADLAGDWLEEAGVKVPRTAAGDVALALEISPLFALDANELQAKVSSETRIAGPMYFV